MDFEMCCSDFFLWFFDLPNDSFTYTQKAEKFIPSRIFRLPQEVLQVVQPFQGFKGLIHSGELSIIDHINRPNNHHHCLLFLLCICQETSVKTNAWLLSQLYNRHGHFRIPLTVWMREQSMLIKLANNTHVRRCASILEDGTEYKMILRKWR